MKKSELIKEHLIISFKRKNVFDKLYLIIYYCINMLLFINIRFKSLDSTYFFASPFNINENNYYQNKTFNIFIKLKKLII
jgi:hypothetical protein